MDKIDYKLLASKLICFVILALFLLLFFKYLFPYVIPFLIAWGIAYMIYPLATELSAKIKISRKICSFVMVLFLLILILSVLFLIVNRLLFEIQNLVDYLVENSERIAGYFKSVFDFFNSIGERLPILSNFQDTGFAESINENVSKFIDGIWKSLIDELGSAVPNLAAGIVTALPNILFVSLITVISCFYFAIDVDVVHSKLKQTLPDRAVKVLRATKRRIGLGLKKYFKAYFLLFTLTFFELLVGFSILGIDYAFVLSVLIAFVDFLPVLGTGAILAPWGIILLLMKNYFVGIGILVLFVITTVVRQIAEPKILGKSLGVHPLLTLVTVYVGFKLFGVVGVIVLPLAIMLIFFKEEPEKEK